MDTSEIKPGVARPAKRGWRRHSEEFKARVIDLARQPGASTAAVALANRLNANMLRRWVREHEAALVVSSAAPAGDAPGVPSFVQLPMIADRAPPSSRPGTVDVQIHRGPTKVAVTLPLDNTSAAWLREVLG
jgi:transposase-like protein